MLDVRALLVLNSLGCYSEEIGKTKFNSMIGLIDRERVDEELYDDYETAKEREVCRCLCCLCFP